MTRRPDSPAAERNAGADRETNNPPGQSPGDPPGQSPGDPPGQSPGDPPGPPTTGERAAAVAAALTARDVAVMTARNEIAASAILGAIRGPAGDRARAEARRLAALAPRDRAREVAALATLARATPAGLDRVHPGWIERAVRGERQAVRRAMRRTDGPASRWLLRRAIAPLVAMPVGPCPAPGHMTPADVPRLEPHTLRGALERLGVEQLAWALASGPPRQLAHIAASLGPHGSALVDRAAALASEPTAGAQLGTRKAASRRLTGLRLGADPNALLRAGARGAAGWLLRAGGDVVDQIAQRLPPEQGDIVRVEIDDVSERPTSERPAAPGAPSAPTFAAFIAALSAVS